MGSQIGAGIGEPRERGRLRRTCEIVEPSQIAGRIRGRNDAYPDAVIQILELVQQRQRRDAIAGW